MKKIILSIALLIVCTTLFCQQNDQLIKVTDQLYMITGYVGNVSVLITDEGVLVVDAGSTHKDGEEIEKLIKTLTDKPIKYLVITHYHDDHAMGACGFSPKPLVIGQSNLPNNLKIYGEPYFNGYVKKEAVIKTQKLKNQLDSLKNINSPDWTSVEKQYQTQLTTSTNLENTFAVYPDTSFDNRMTLTLGKDTINLIYPGRTHTSCNIIVEFVNQNALSTGDMLFNHAFPYIDYAAGCNTENWADQLAHYASKNYQYIIPGHGKLATSEDLIDAGKYLSDLRDSVSTELKAGRTLDEMKKEIKMSNYSHYDFHFLIPMDIEAVYYELTNPKE
jgi:cyclase